MNDLTIAYVIFAIVLLHLVIGFAWVIYKFSKKDSGTDKNDREHVESKNN